MVRLRDAWLQRHDITIGLDLAIVFRYRLQRRRDGEDGGNKESELDECVREEDHDSKLHLKVS